ncbi:hypothetical protein IFM12275_00380 [Nocardia sputorum]|uniref:Uncharacterized protein n=1 Tax=Nocardia sputorum TaxID=2984338 RepID=A0ABN6U0I3_9NOCA|nr:hypothetical protein IFM12275_00380 [Nocardia sputorum]BDT98687.1 hypothetical protein IFM12276_17160 [Nocardia sputorum]
MKFLKSAAGVTIALAGIFASTTGTALADDPTRFPGFKSENDCHGWGQYSLQHTAWVRNYKCVHEGGEWVIYLSDH